MKPRQEIDILQDTLVILKERPKRNREIVVSTYLNDLVWRKYRTRMLELGLIDEVKVEPGRVVYDITPRGEELLNLIDVYRSIWQSFPPKPVKKQFKPWLEAVLKHIYEKGETGFTVKEAWICTQNVDRISRTQVSTFLHRMAEKGILENNPRPGPGGIHGFFTLKTPKHNLESFLEDVYPSMINYSGKTMKDK